MKDHTSNIIAKRFAEIAASKAAIRNDEAQIDAMKKDIEEQERNIFKLCGQIKGMNTADLSAEQLANVIDALYDEQEYHSKLAELSMRSSVRTWPSKVYPWSYRLKKLIWLSSHFELDAAAVDSYLVHLLQDYPEKPESAKFDRGPGVEDDIIVLVRIYENKGKPLSTFALIKTPINTFGEIVPNKIIDQEPHYQLKVLDNNIKI